MEQTATHRGEMNQGTRQRGWRTRPGIVLAALLVLLVLSLPVWGQEIDGNPDHPAGNVNELTLAGLRPGRSTLREAVRLYGAHWFHPTPQETDLYLWSDPAHHLLLSA